MSPLTPPAVCAITSHVYASPGPDRDKFVALVTAFNARPANPTSWVVHTHGDGDASTQLEALISEKLASMVVLAGKNDTKLSTISRLITAGIHVLADKPWATSLESLSDLGAATAPDASALAMDIMTNKHDVIAKIRREIVNDPALFGGFRTDGDLPCVEIGSVHHLMKLVNGAPLRRPAWYYDVGVQGNGLVDITSHMVDQVQWLLAEHTAEDYDFGTDCVLTSAATTDTEVPIELFCDSTGLAAFPEFLEGLLRESELEGSGPLWAGGGGVTVLPLAANGALEYKLRGVSVRHTAEWRPREPAGGGDLHSATLRGMGCEVTVRCDDSTGYKQELLLTPASTDGPAVDAFGASVVAAIARWNNLPQFKGVSASHVPEKGGWVIDVPAEIAPTHEEHFALAMEEFLDHITIGWPPLAGEGGNGWPPSLVSTHAIPTTT